MKWQALIDGLDIRNELSHDYSNTQFEVSDEVLSNEVYPALHMLYGFFIAEGGHGEQKLLDGFKDYYN